MFFYGGHQDLLRHLQIGRLEGSDYRMGAFGRIDRLIQQVDIVMQPETGLLADDINLIFDQTSAMLRIRNDYLTVKRPPIGLEVSNRNPHCAPQYAMAFCPIPGSNPGGFDGKRSTAIQRQQPPHRSSEPYAGLIPL